MGIKGKVGILQRKTQILPARILYPIFFIKEIILSFK